MKYLCKIKISNWQNCERDFQRSFLWRNPVTETQKINALTVQCFGNISMFMYLPNARMDPFPHTCSKIYKYFLVDTSNREYEVCIYSIINRSVLAFVPNIKKQLSATNPDASPSLF